VPIAVALAAWHASRLFAVAPGPAWIGIAAGCIAGCAAADVVTGAVHWACDTWGNERTPVFGASLIRSFREHHTHPRAMLGHDWIEVNGEATSAAAAALGILALPAVQASLAGRPFLYALLWALISVAALGNQLHQWAHADRVPGAIRTLQRIGVVLSPGRHARHHRGAHLSGYCITTGWMNPVLDSTHFWRALERAVSMVTGARPREHEVLEGDGHRI
jgi:ubiquitin-conjugating enzyme E2 variant